MTNQDRPSYNTVPHYFAKDYRSGKLKLNELLLLLWLRATGDPYGVATTSLNDLRDDIFPELKKNTVNSILLSLRKKSYVFYEMRQGKTGTFDIHLDHWQTPKNGYKTLDKYFQSDEKGADTEDKPIDKPSYPQANRPEASQKLEEQNQKLFEVRAGLINKFSGNSESRPIRSYHNEHDTEPHLENHDTLEKSFNGTLVGGFNPTNHEEQRCWEIASELGEKFMNPILSVLRTDGGFRQIEQAWGIYREDRAANKHIDHPARYFFGIIKKQQKQR